MTNTPFSKKCEILAEAWVELDSSEIFAPLFADYDVGFPLAHAVFYGYANTTDTGVALIDEAWSAFCEIIGIDKYGEFVSLDEMIFFDEIINE